ncbi:outer membrane lipoprotein-sorting protein [Aureisphaera galaxeae]|uniref:outer membrane lipoprotein-sorting protein n=1 Tax=Aureisphaera galaxeae TaxID=1538023 RepID=UPI002350C087|nr:outer membrane lipoprotein-sorting protein [Aureisphaera galaxeae]MDC8004367.1 outer membrane lipoprotein-sorting protein [Aureisphaera galaxeae]
MKTLKLLFVLCALVAFTPNTQAQTAEEIVDNFFENTGGMDAWKKIKSMKATGTASFGPQKFPFIMYTMVDGRMAAEVDLQGSKFIPQAFDGEKQWAMNFQTMEAEAADSEASQNYKANEAKDFPDPFLDYKSKGYTISYEGKETIEGTEAFKVKLTKNPIMVDGKEEAHSVMYYFDTENYVPIVSEEKITSGPQKGMVQQTLYSEYLEAGDIFYPYTFDVKMGGQVVQSINMTEVEFNADIDESIFVMPEKATPAEGTKN